MAETINIENSRYEFEVILIARVVSTSNASGYEYKSIPISKSGIKYFEIRDDLVNYGYTGVITFSNYFGILQKLGMYNAAEEAPYIQVSFKNLDFSQAGRTAPSVYFLASLGKSSETSANVIDKHATFEFEEYLVSKLKRISSLSVTSADVAVNEIGMSDTPRGNTAMTFPTGTPADLIKGLIQRGAKSAGITTSVSISGTPMENKGLLANFGLSKNSISIFDATKDLSSYLSFKAPSDAPSEFSNFPSPGIIKITNTPDYKQRQVVIESLADNINGFFKLIKSNKTSDKISNYLTEKFITALSNDSRTFGDNFIKKYDLMRVNYEDVYENKWVNYEVICGPSDCTSSEPYPYEYLRSAFERLFTAPYATNIPKRTEDANNGVVKTTTYALRNIDKELAVGFGTNRILKSFIFDNIALTFRVKGQPYRTSGKFIQIEADGSSSSSSKNIKTDELNGYWYIISIKHVFENDIYFNDYVCVKLYSNYGNLSEIPNRNAGVSLGSSSGSSSGSSIGGNESLNNQTGEDLDRILDNQPNQDFVEETPAPDDQEGNLFNTWWPWPSKNETTSSTQQFWQTRSATPTSNDFVLGRRRSRAEIDANLSVPDNPTGTIDADNPLLPPLRN